LNVDSSSGYPWVLKLRKKGKRDFLDNDKKVIDDRMIRACEEREMRASIGKRSLTVFSDHLKDERRPKKGQKFLKPRLFSAGPLDFTLVFRQYFGAFIAFVIRHRIENSVGIGINPHGLEWTMLADHMHQKGDDILAGDFSNYDGTLNAEMLWCVLEVVNAWYVDGNSNIREVLWSEIVNSVHLYRNHLYVVDHGNPSGNPITTVLNSLYQYLAWVYVFLDIGVGLCEFCTHVDIVTYGDDNIVSVRGARFDPDIIVEGFKKIGMVLTSDVKDEAFHYKPLSEVTFLKRRFVYNDLLGRFLAPLPFDTLVEMLYWYHKPHHWKEVGYDIIQASVRECAHHGIDVFNEFVDKLTRVLVDRGLRVDCFLTCGEYQLRMLEDGYLDIVEF